MTVYSKTMAGRIAAVDQQPKLNPALKEFLKLVDGKTPAGQLLTQWRDGPDAAQLLQELERLGLVEVRSVRWSNSSANSAFSQSTSQISVLPATVATAVAKVDASTNTQAQAELSSIKDHMATFILTHLPHRAIPVLKEIEDIANHHALQCMLAAYAHLVHEAGRTGLAHIKSLRGMLEPDFKPTV